MDAKWMRRLALGPVLVVAALAAGGAHAQEVPLVTGEHWVKSSEPVKKACLVGMANILQVEAAHQAGNAPVLIHQWKFLNTMIVQYFLSIFQ